MGKHDSCFLETLKYWPLEKEQAKKQTNKERDIFFVSISKRSSSPFCVAKMPRTFFFLTEVHFGGCGCYTSSDRWSKYDFNATAIGIR